MSASESYNYYSPINQRRLDAVRAFGAALYNLAAALRLRRIRLVVGRFDLSPDERVDLLRANAYTLIHSRDLGLACTFTVKDPSSAIALANDLESVRTIWRELGGIVPPDGPYPPHLAWRLP